MRAGATRRARSAERSKSWCARSRGRVRPGATARTRKERRCFPVREKRCVPHAHGRAARQLVSLADTDILIAADLVRWCWPVR
eukprot:5430124-Prymnesium_polylepis.1